MLRPVVVVFFFFSKRLESSKVKNMMVGQRMGGLEVGWPLEGMGVPLPDSSAHERHDQLILGIFFVNSGYSLRVLFHSVLCSVSSHQVELPLEEKLIPHPSLSF